MKKVGLLIPTLSGGGAERVVSRLTYILSEEYKIYTIVFEDNYIDYDYTGELINLNIKSTKTVISKIILPFRRAYKLRQIKKSIGMDVVISFLESPNIVNILSNVKNCKTVISVRNYMMKENKLSFIARITNLFMKILYNKSDKVISVSEEIKKSLIQDYGIKANKIKTIYNPYDTKLIKKFLEEEIKYEHKYIFEDKDIIYISVGRQMYQKGFWHLAKAFKLVKEKQPNSKLIIIGKDYNGGKLKKLIQEMKLEESIILLGHQENPFKYINKSDVYITSSIFEGFPNSLVEAMACGCPVISVDCKSGPREILYENYNLETDIKGINYADYGVIVQELSPDENWDIDHIEKEEKILSEAMLNVYKDKETKDKYSKLAKKRSEQFNYEECKKQYTEVIEELTKESHILC